MNEKLKNYAKAMLIHRNGTDGEDVYIIHHVTGERIAFNNKGKNILGVAISKEDNDKIQKEYKGKIIGIHNHPSNLLPIGSDFAIAGYRGYEFGVVVTHDGKVYKYGVGEKFFNPLLIDGKM